jgi:hypothetical protein
MKSLENQFISDTYKSLLHTLSNDGVPSSGVDDIYDGDGKQTALSLGAKDKGAVISGPFTAGNVTYPTSTDIKPLIDVLFPIGSVYFTATNQNPSTFMGGAWSAIAAGRFVVGVGTGTDSTGNQQTFNAGTNDGTYNKALDSTNVPPHFHYVANADRAYAQTAPTVSSSTTVIADAYAVASRSYTLRGSSVEATIGKTSTVGNIDSTDGVGSPISITPPSFGLYIWRRTA